MAVQIEKEQLQGALSNTYYSLMINETTDVAVLNAVADPGGARGAQSSPPFCQESVQKIVNVD